MDLTLFHSQNYRTLSIRNEQKPSRRFISKIFAFWKKKTRIFLAPTPSNNEDSYQDNECDYWIKITSCHRWNLLANGLYSVYSTEFTSNTTGLVTAPFHSQRKHTLSMMLKWVKFLDLLYRRRSSCVEETAWCSGSILLSVGCMSFWIRADCVLFEFARTTSETANKSSHVSHMQTGTCRLCIKNINPKSHNCFRPNQ